MKIKEINADQKHQLNQTVPQNTVYMYICSVYMCVCVNCVNIKRVVEMSIKMKNKKRERKLEIERREKPRQN